jgi:hypothetical protein
MLPSHAHIAAVAAHETNPCRRGNAKARANIAPKPSPKRW